MNECTFIIFGTTGDLAKRKIIPALYHLLVQRKLQKILIIGAAFEQKTIEEILAGAADHIQGPTDDTAWSILKSSMHYQRVDFGNHQDFHTLAEQVNALEKQYGMSGNRLVYCAVASSFFCAITQQVVEIGLIKKATPGEKTWNRIVYEKPFGKDKESAHEINNCIAQLLDEKQVYRIDHYLTKELVANIALIRFTNCVFEPLWNNRFIDNVQIVLSEQVGVAGRGGYYDNYGALRDVVQNHMLEVMALIAMESPEKLTGEYIRDARAKALEKVRFVDGVLGQYAGYTQEKDVAPDSKTETFAALYLTIDNLRWRGVPFYLKTGKHLDKKETVIHIKFKQVDCLLTKNCPTESNYLTIRLYPNEAFFLTLNAKKLGASQEIEPVSMQYSYKGILADTESSGYETLLEEVLRGEQSVSVRFDEIEYAWQVIDTVRSHHLSVYEYPQGSKGPEAVEQFAKKHGMRWRS
jgi:glucose-6-phosphate 1-dehydrogenase